MFFIKKIIYISKLHKVKKQFTEQKIALALYEFIDHEVYLNLNEYSEDFFEILTLVGEQGKPLSLLIIYH